MKLEKMDRVFVPSTGHFGHVQRKGGILGIKDSYAVIDDTGKRLIYTGKCLGDFVYSETKKTPLGDEQEIPTDGITLFQKEFPGCGRFCAKYNKMTPSERQALCDKWSHMSMVEKKCVLDESHITSGKSVTRRHKNTKR